MIRTALGLVALFAATTPQGAGPIGYTLVAAPAHAPSPLDRGPPGFDPRGNACVRDEARLTRVPARGPAETLDFAAAARTAIERDLLGGKAWDGRFDRSLMVDNGIVFDAAARAYTLVVPRYSNLKTAALLWSADGCRTWRALALAGINATMEKPDSFNDHAGPPTILSHENYGSKRGGRLWLELFSAAGDDVRRIGEAQPVAADSLLVANHSGAGNSTFTTAKSVFVVYPTTDASAPGTLSVARAWDRAAGRWSGPAQPIARSTTKVGPDNHDIPAITKGPDGRLRVVIGAHHAVLRMVTASAPDSIAGWSAPEPVGAPELGRRFAEYSYVSLDTGRDGTINIVARAEFRGGPYELVQLRRPAGGSWRSWPDKAPDRTIARPNRASYAAFRQRVSRAPDGALYLSFGYFPNQLTGDEAKTLGVADIGERCAGPAEKARCWFRAAPTIGAVTLVSRDEGATWR